jgi:hypothetical protein
LELSRAVVLEELIITIDVLKISGILARAMALSTSFLVLLYSYLDAAGQGGVVAAVLVRSSDLIAGRHTSQRPSERHELFSFCWCYF